MTGNTTRPPEYLAMAIQHELEPREPSGPENHLESQERSLTDDHRDNRLKMLPEPTYCGTFPEPTTKATRCRWTMTYITACYQFLRRALLCRPKGNNTLAPTKNVGAEMNDTRTCANMNCERHALDEKCTKYPVDLPMVLAWQFESGATPPQPA
jgi:hypothetical protein